MLVRRVAAALAAAAITVGLAVTLPAAATARPGGFVVSETQFNQMFPNRNTFYSQTVTVPVKDQCPGYDSSHIDLGKPVFTQLTGGVDLGDIPVT